MNWCVGALLAAAVWAAAPDLPRLRADGRTVVTTGGQPFVWKGVTAFRLLEYVAHGQESQATGYLDWAHANGFNVVRVLSTLCCWFDLTPADGERALPRLLELAKSREMYVQIVGLAGTGDRPFDYAAHLRAIGAIAERDSTIALVELANEPHHGSQDRRLSENGFAYLRELAAVLPKGVPVAEGDGASGSIVTRHIERAPKMGDIWPHLHELADLSAKLNKPVLSGEPIGAGEETVEGRRSADPHFFFEYGRQCRKLEILCNFHLEDGLQSVVPRPHQQSSAKAFIDGLTMNDER